MNAKEKSHPDSGKSEREATETAAFGEAAISSDDSITNGGDGQVWRPSQFLLRGEEHAISGPELARMLNVNPRTLRLMVDAERLERPICASDRGYFLHDDGTKGIQELRRFVRRQDSRCAANRRVTKSAKAVLKEFESKPLDGQASLEGW